MDKREDLIPFNINSYVRIKLTDKGKEVLKKKWKTSYLVLYENARKEEGWFEFQMWNFMEIFGSEMYMGNSLLFETEIQIQSFRWV